MTTLLLYFLFASVAVFMGGTVLSFILAMFLLGKGWPSLSKKDRAGFLNSVKQVPWAVRALLVIRKIQNISWWAGLACGIALVIWAALTEPAAK